ncbi:nucleotidyltransferase substrate binding protein [Synechococcus sp. CBW1108]|uniref:nucleotidyltransferase substrate binding protein n=1 Tax=Synechococcus sp. CBW1108 TaxID=1353147 RepID=UPI0018CF2B97|nr:nucleotidyltransferase substrate binding protein [Synechococcus sp. CBW1108]QPN71373.1 nucleotidyltransferase substrate binding protein [Synechococcus sp. CBW1108]
MPPDIRGQQRFANFCLALDQLETFFEPPALNERVRQGLIKAFEYCFDLGWNPLRLAFRMGLIDDGEGWLAMVQDRNLTSHPYNRSTAAAEEGDG